jgi:ADP-ribose pyrophosphatase
MPEGKQGSWEVIRTEPGPELKLFRARFDWLKNPRNACTVKAVVLEAPDWVNVVAVTPEGKVVAVRQYRFGKGGTTTEIPAGIVEPGETSEEAGVRELKEETGYTSSRWEYLGYVEPNPAFLNNRCHHWLALDASSTDDPNLDDGEDVTVAEMTVDELKVEITEGRMRHALAITALSRLFDLWRR